MQIPNIDTVMSLIERHCNKLDLPFNKEYKLNVLHNLDDTCSYLSVVADSGYFIGIITQHPFTGELVAMELAFYSEQPGLGSQLLKGFEDWCKEKNVSKIIITSQSKYPIDKYLERKGYEAREVSFVKEL